LLIQSNIISLLKAKIHHTSFPVASP